MEALPEAVAEILLDADAVAEGEGLEEEDGLAEGVVLLEAEGRD